MAEIYEIGSRVTVTNINDGTNYTEANGTIVGWHDIGRGATQAIVALDESHEAFGRRIIHPLSLINKLNKEVH